jgi:hypothetical protein
MVWSHIWCLRLGDEPLECRSERFFTLVDNSLAGKYDDLLKKLARTNTLAYFVRSVSDKENEILIVLTPGCRLKIEKSD